MVDVIEFKIEKVVYTDKPVEVVNILINGENLFDLLSLDAKWFCRLSPHLLLFPSPHLLGRVDPEHKGYNGNPIIYCDACGDVECNHIEVEITIKKEIVIWKNFSEADNTGQITQKEFRFDRKQYEEALGKKEGASAKWKDFFGNEIDTSHLKSHVGLIKQKFNFLEKDWNFKLIDEKYEEIDYYSQVDYASKFFRVRIYYYVKFDVIYVYIAPLDAPDEIEHLKSTVWFEPSNFVARALSQKGIRREMFHPPFNLPIEEQIDIILERFKPDIKIINEIFQKNEFNKIYRDKYGRDP